MVYGLWFMVYGLWFWVIVRNHSPTNGEVKENRYWLGKLHVGANRASDLPWQDRCYYSHDVPPTAHLPAYAAFISLRRLELYGGQFIH